MKKILLLCGMLAISASVASAAQNNLAWDNCLGGGGLQAKTSPCNSNVGNNFLFSSVTAPAGMDRWAAFEQELRFVGNNRTAVRPWWQLRGTGQCRAGALLAGADFSSVTGCQDAYALGGGGSGGIGAWQINNPVPGDIRLTLVFAVPAGSEQALTPDAEYYVARLQITNAKTVGTGACAGCNEGMCIAVINTKVVQPAGAAGGNVDVSNPNGGGTTNHVSWQVSDQFPCAGVPTQRQTWGRVKSLYR